MSESPELRVEHDAKNFRFLLFSDDTVAGVAEYCEVQKTDGPSVRDFNHTVIDPQFRGMGFSKPLIQAALEQTAKDGLLVRPSCSAVFGYMSKNPEFQNLIER